MLPAHQPLLTQLREPPRRRFIVTSTSAVEVPGPGDLGAPPTSLGWQSAGPRLQAPLGLWDAGSRPPPQNQTQLPVPGALHALQTVLYWSVYEGPSRDPSDTCVGAPQRQGASRGAGWINGSCRQVRGAALTAVGQRPLRQQLWEAVSREGGARCPRTFPVRPRASLPSEPDADSSERGTNVSLIRRCSRPLPPRSPQPRDVTAAEGHLRCLSHLCVSPPTRPGPHAPGPPPSSAGGQSGTKAKVRLQGTGSACLSV